MSRSRSPTKRRKAHGNGKSAPGRRQIAAENRLLRAIVRAMVRRHLSAERGQFQIRSHELQQLAEGERFTMSPRQNAIVIGYEPGKVDDEESAA